MKSGFVAVVGRANVGKSSITNALVGEKVAIVSPKPQTTRNRILGILTQKDYQIILVDTPGVFAPKNLLGEFMMKSVGVSTEGADMILLVIDSDKGLTRGDTELLERYIVLPIPMIVAVNKIDIGNYSKVYPILSKLSEYTFADKKIAEIIPVSAKTKNNIDVLTQKIASFLPDGELLYPEDAYTDKTERFIIAEIIREKALICLDEEIPHGIGVAIDSIKDEERIVQIAVDIVVERANHKAIIIGHNGSMLKKIGTQSRIDIEKLLDKKVNLAIFVKVRESWRNNNNICRDIGYDKKNL